MHAMISQACSGRFWNFFLKQILRSFDLSTYYTWFLKRNWPNITDNSKGWITTYRENKFKIFCSRFVRSLSKNILFAREPIVYQHGYQLPHLRFAKFYARAHMFDLGLRVRYFYIQYIGELFSLGKEHHISSVTKLRFKNHRRDGTSLKAIS